MERRRCRDAPAATAASRTSTTRTERAACSTRQTIPRSTKSAFLRGNSGFFVRERPGHKARFTAPGERFFAPRGGGSSASAATFLFALPPIASREARHVPVPQRRSRYFFAFFFAAVFF